MKKTKNDNLFKFSTQTPWQFVFVVLLYLVGSTGFPISIFTFFLGDSLNAKLISTFIARIICCILPVYLIFEIKLKNILKFKQKPSCFLFLIPFLLVVINNFPLLPLINGEAKIMQNEFLTWFLYLLVVFAGAFLEEVTFRALVLPVIYRKFKNEKNRAFISVLITSILFGGAHLFNLLAGANIGSVIVQIGYSFLIGGMCGIAFVKTGNFYNCVLLHFIFNIGGLLYEYQMISGIIWTQHTILITAILAVLVIIYAVILIFKTPNCEFENNIAVDRVIE